MRTIIAVSLLLFMLSPLKVFANVGVGVATGKIVVDESLKAGMIYELPPLTVVNTGSVATNYVVDVSYQENQPQNRPQREWIVYTPETFHLDPGKSQAVSIKLHLPVNAEPGEYFAYLEGRPNNEIKEGKTKVGIAAASKLYFTVEASNIWSGIYHRLRSLWTEYAPWPKIIFFGVSTVIGILVTKNLFNIQISIKKKSTERL